jgi:hypothetical protein
MSKGSGPQPDSCGMWACRGSDCSKERLGNEARKNLLEPKTLHTKPTSTGGGTAQRVGYPIYINPHLGKLSDQIRVAPHSTDSKNLVEHHPPQCQELPRTNENTMEPPNRPPWTDLLDHGPTGRVIYS